MDDHCLHLLFSANRWEAREKILAKLNAGTTLIGAGVFGAPIVWGFSGTIYEVIVFNKVLERK